MRAVAIVAACALLYGCATPWPHVTGQADPVFAHRLRPVARIDVLPIDLALWVDSEERGSPETLRMNAEGELATAINAALLQHGYVVNAALDWQGNTTGDRGEPVRAMDPPALLATIDALSTYGTAASRATAGLPVPYLPVHLGDVTRGDATLYVGGWSFVGDTETSNEDIAKYVLIGVLLVAVIVIVIAAAKSSSGHGGGGGGGGGIGGALDGAGHVLVSAGRIAATSAARVATTVARVVAEGAPRMVDALGRTADAFGHIDTSIELCDTRPDWHADGPKDGNSAMYLEMTLVDNHTGLVLWHARERFPASGAKREDLDHVIASMMETLPSAP